MPIPRVPTSIFAFFLVLMFAFAPAATAGEGVVEINAVCAAAGCFQGDAPGFPVTLDGSAG